MSQEEVCCDVVVIGAGPVGMTSAALLAARGLDVVVLETRMTTSDEPKAISIDDEALRVYQQAGIVQDILEIVVPGTGTQYYDSNNEPMLYARAAIPYHLGYPFKNPFAQPDLERQLLASLRRNPRVDVRFGTEVIDLDQTPESITVSGHSAAGAVRVNASYAVGADGGRSTTRELLGIELTGRSYDEVWLVVDTVEDPHTERYGMHHGFPDRPHVIIPGLGGRCRYEFLLRPGEGEAGEVPSLDLVRRLLAPYREVEAEHVERATNYRFHALVAGRWWSGRTFLVGDAAHMMPPFAGQGLNSGVRDAANLMWKIADVLTERLPPLTLGTYEEERRPHAQATVRLSEKLGRVVMTTSPRLAHHRDELIGHALLDPGGREFFETMRYRPAVKLNSALILPEAEECLAGTAIGQPRVYDQASHRPALLDDVLGNGWALLGVDIEDESDWADVDTIAKAFDARPAAVPLDDTLPRVDRTVLIDVDGGLQREFSPATGRFVLLRPDHVVAATWRPHESPTVAAELSRWSARATSSHT